MPRSGATTLALPEFTGATRRLVLINLVAFFILLLTQFAFPSAAGAAAGALAMSPSSFLSGAIWQPITYSLIHVGIWGTAMELLSLWFLGSFLEAGRGGNWMQGLYIASVLGAALTAAAICIVGGMMNAQLPDVSLIGCMGGIFGMLVAIGVLFGDIQFLLFFVIGIKAKYLAAIYALVAIAMLFGQQKMYAFAQLGGALAGLLYIRLAPRRGVGFVFSERLYGLRNRYYRWKRRRAARKFEVYMHKQGRTVRFDGQGRKIDTDRIDVDQDDKKRWN
jgi:membrane associated rhomboid family serine protease